MFVSLLVSAILMTAPSGAQTKPADPKAGGQAKPAASSAVRTIDITATDDMKYSVTEIPAKAGETLRLRLVSKGTLPKVAMAHNVVVLKAGAKQNDFANAAALARATDFIPTEMKDQVIGASTLAGPDRRQNGYCCISRGLSATSAAISPSYSKSTRRFSRILTASWMRVLLSWKS